MVVRWFAAVACCAVVTTSSFAQDDAGNTFFEAEELAFGQLSVSAELLTDLYGADLYLGVRDGTGAIALDGFGNELVDDDSSPYGDGFAPALYGVPVNPGGEISFDITGYEDTEFLGEHTQFGEFEVFVDIYSQEGGNFVYLDGLYYQDYLDDLVEEQSLLSFFDSNPDWDGAFYDIAVNNAFPNDVDFFRFVGLTPGEAFTAETLEAEGGFVDTALGLFDDNGDLIASDDDGGEFGYSKLTGVVPASGEVVLAVSGYEDLDFFEGAHRFMGPYELALTLGDPDLAGDYDGDLDVDEADYDLWTQQYGFVDNPIAGVGIASDGNGDGRVDAADYTVWRDAFDAQPLAVPEPTGGLLLLVALATRALVRAR